MKLDENTDHIFTKEDFIEKTYEVGDDPDEDILATILDVTENDNIIHIKCNTICKSGSNYVRTDAPIKLDLDDEDPRIEKLSKYRLYSDIDLIIQVDKKQFLNGFNIDNYNPFRYCEHKYQYKVNRNWVATSKDKNDSDTCIKELSNIFNEEEMFKFINIEIGCFGEELFDPSYNDYLSPFDNDCFIQLTEECIAKILK